MLKLTILGNIGKDAVVRAAGQKFVVSFTVAHTDKPKNSEPKVTWVEISIFKDTQQEGDNIAQYIKKGGMIYVEGKPEVRTWTNQNNETQAGLSMISNTFQFCGSNSQQPAAAPAAQPQAQYQQPQGQQYQQPAPQYQQPAPQYQQPQAQPQYQQPVPTQYQQPQAPPAQGYPTPQGQPVPPQQPQGQPQYANPPAGSAPQFFPPGGGRDPLSDLPF